MRYMTATKAASILGKSEKTVRRWISEGKLEAHHPKPNQLAIAESDVERLKRELAQYESQSEDTRKQEPEQNISSLAAHVQALQQELEDMRLLSPGPNTESLVYTSSLESRIDRLEERLDRIERMLQGTTTTSTEPTNTPVRAERISRQKATTEPTDATHAPFPDALLIKDFAIAHGVNTSTFRDHVRKGIGPDKEKAPAFARPKPNRPGETEYFILPEQREQVYDYWRRHKVYFTSPVEQETASQSEDNGSQEEESKESQE